MMEEIRNIQAEQGWTDETLLSVLMDEIDKFQDPLKTMLLAQIQERCATPDGMITIGMGDDKIIIEVGDNGSASIVAGIERCTVDDFLDGVNGDHEAAAVDCARFNAFADGIESMCTAAITQGVDTQSVMFSQALQTSMDLLCNEYAP